MSRVSQYKAFAGDLPNIFPDGEYLSVDPLGQNVTFNESAWKLWDIFNREIQQISVANQTQQPLVTRDLIEPIILGVNRCFAAAQDHVVTRANTLFASTFGGAPPFMYQEYAIRWPDNNRQALSAVMSFVSAIFQIPQVNSNRLDNGVIDSDASIIVRPLYQLKANIMREMFGIEVQGHVSPDELDAIFRDSNLKPPLRSSWDDKHDSAATLAGEDSLALTNESAQAPSAETVEQVKAGVEVWTWVPSEANWATFAEIARRYQVNGPTSAPGEPFPFTVGGPIAGANVGGTAARAAGLAPQS